MVLESYHHLYMLATTPIIHGVDGLMTIQKLVLWFSILPNITLRMPTMISADLTGSKCLVLEELRMWKIPDNVEGKTNLKF